MYDINYNVRYTFQILDKCISYSNLSKDEWQAIRSLGEDRSIIIKRADKGLCVVVWDRLDYLSEAEKQLGDKNIYKDASFNDKILGDLVETSNQMFLNLKRKGSISEKEMKYFVYNYKNASNLGKLCFLPKIQKRLSNVPGRRVISICRTPTEKASEFLYYHLKPVMQRSWYYIKNSEDFIEKIKKISNTPDGANLVTADVVGLYPSIPHQLGLNALEEAPPPPPPPPKKKETLHRFQHPILSKWLNLYFKIVILNLMERLNNKFLVTSICMSIHGPS